MTNVVRLPINPRPRPVEDPAAEPLPAVRYEIGPAAVLLLLLLALPWVVAIELLMPRRRRQ